MRARRRAAGWVGMAIFALASATVCGAQEAESPESRLRVSGEGVVSRPPDLAVLDLGIETEDAQASEAQARVNAAANAIYASLAELGVEPRDLQTAELRIGPVYSRGSSQRGSGEDAPRIVGYRASNQVRVRVRDLEGLGQMIDAGLAAGANRVDGVSFQLENDRDARTEALRLAVRDARSKSQAMAEALDVELGAVRSLSESVSGSPRPAPVMRMAAAEVDSATPTAAGAIQVRARVELEYELR